LRRVASITFVCGTPIGGAVDSTVSLAEQARAHGHSVALLVAAKSGYDRLPRVTAGIVRVGERSQQLGAVAWRLHDRLSSRTSSDPVPLVERASEVVAAARRRHRPGALLVINSVRRLDLQRLLDLAHRSGSHSVWYLREVASLAMAAELGPLVGTLMANSRPLAEQASELAGRPCRFIPSVISREGLTEPERRERLLLVNPIASHGLETVLSLARARPDRTFALQESWTLEPEMRVALQRSVEGLGNVEVRPRADRSHVFRDARALLLPHDAEELGSSRPRVALEAQLLGIPIVANDIPGLASLAGSAELLVPDGAGLEAWLGTLDRLDQDYERYSAEARRLADREMPSSEAVWAAFSTACGSILEP
jgi:hypothetical protein